MSMNINFSKFYPHFVSLFSVIELQSYSKAAKILNISNSTISRHIGLLEEALGYKLIMVSDSGLHFTEKALKLYQSLANKFMNINEVINLEQVGHHSVEPLTLRLLLPYGVAVVFSEKVLPKLLKQHPKLQCFIDTIELSSSESVVLKSQQYFSKYDVIMIDTIFEHLIKQDVWKQIYTTSSCLRLCAHRDISPMIQCLSDLDHHNIVAYGNFNTIHIWNIFSKTLQQSLQYSVKPALVTNLTHIRRNLIASGQMVGLIADHAWLFGKPDCVVNLFPDYDFGRSSKSLYCYNLSDFPEIALEAAQRLRDYAKSYSF